MEGGGKKYPSHGTKKLAQIVHDVALLDPGYLFLILDTVKVLPASIPCVRRELSGVMLCFFVDVQTLSWEQDKLESLV